MFLRIARGTHVRNPVSEGSKALLTPTSSDKKVFIDPGLDGILKRKLFHISVLKIVDDDLIFGRIYNPIFPHNRPSGT